MLTQWDKIKAAERMQAYIEAHLGDRISTRSRTLESARSTLASVSPRSS